MTPVNTKIITSTKTSDVEISALKNINNVIAEKKSSDSRQHQKWSTFVACHLMYTAARELVHTPDWMETVETVSFFHGGVTATILIGVSNVITRIRIARRLGCILILSVPMHAFTGLKCVKGLVGAELM